MIGEYLMVAYMFEDLPPNWHEHIMVHDMSGFIPKLPIYDLLKLYLYLLLLTHLPRLHLRAIKVLSILFYRKNNSLRNKLPIERQIL